MNVTLPLADALSFAGKTVLITGEAAGIGQATARRFAEAGARLQVLDRDADRLQRLRDDLGREFDGPAIDSHVVDLADMAAIGQLWADLPPHETPDILVNNAGIYPMRAFLEVDDALFSRVLDVNLTATFWMCQHFIQRRGTRGGVIVNISTIEAVLPFNADLVHYAASKAGVIALTRSLARDYGAAGIRANVILPGGIKTPGTVKLARRALQRLDVGTVKSGYDFQQRLPKDRWGEPDEVAKAIVFLASDLASYVHGAVLPVDGGFLSS